MELIKANLGKMAEGRYFEATDDKQQAFYVDVVDQKRVQDPGTGQWSDGKAIWYQAKFSGRDADWVRDTLQNGDPLLLWGTTRNRTKEVDGKKYDSIDLFVDAVSVNPRKREFTIDRTPRASRDVQQTATQEASQDVDAEADLERAAQYRQMFGTRLGEVFEQRHIDEQTGNMLLAVWDDTNTPPEDKPGQVREIVAEYGAAPAVGLYLTSVIDEHAGTGRALSRNEAATQAAPAPVPDQAQVPQDPWAAVQQARHEVAQPAAAAPAM
ncbi:MULTISPECIES: hypothetical protein [unclassified Leucobacter]|uniref:hypothetical protein n=1 Tax=unclassified Leucobacter TaxID=2621730 RepID=UPI0030194DA9